MKKRWLKKLRTLRPDTIRLLYRDLGAIKAGRIVQTIMGSTGDYTKDRHAYFGDLTVQEILAAMEKDRKSKARRAAAA